MILRLFLKQTYILFFSLLIVPILSFSDEYNCTSVKYPAPSGVKNSIEFIFDKPYACGKFANGDWWVSDIKGNGVKIIAITPAPNDGFNGYEINPNSKTKQSFDKRISGYTPELILSFPLKLTDASIVKVVSVSPSKKKCRPCIQFAAVLTVTQKPVRSSINVFRPGYYGAVRNFTKLDKLNTKKLGYFTSQYIVKKSKYSFDFIANSYRGVRLDHIEGWSGRSMHPIDNMPDYGAEIASNNAVAILRMLLDDFNINNKKHKQALVNYIQMAIDLNSMVKGGLTWPANGGHGNGRKLPLLFASEILHENIFTKASKKKIFSEDLQVYFSPTTGRALYGRNCDDLQYWKRERFANGKRDCGDPYGFIDGGGNEIGEAYQKCCTAKPWKYTALVIHLMDMRDKWGNDAFLHYVDRWVNHGVWAKPDPCAGYNGNSSDYGKKYGPTNGPNCIVGNGRYMYKHGANRDAGFYSNNLAELMWNEFRKKSE